MKTDFLTFTKIYTFKKYEGGTKFQSLPSNLHVPELILKKGLTI